MEQVTKGVLLCGRFATGYKDGQTVSATHLWREDIPKDEMAKHPVLKLDGLTVSLITPWAGNYFHWLLEELTMILCLDPAKIDHILVAPWYPPRCFESLECLGLSRKVCHWTEYPTTVDLLSFGPQRADGFSYMPGLRMLIERFKQKPDGPAKIFVDRGNAQERRVKNIREVRERLPDYQFITPKGSIQEQSAYFGNAEHLIGPHGAGLVNMIWAKHCKVTDLQGSYHNPCFEKLAAQLGHEYEAVQCKPVGKDM